MEWHGAIFGSKMEQSRFFLFTYRGIGFYWFWGVFFAGKWSQGHWPAWVKDSKFSIEFLEMIPIYIYLIVWNLQLWRKRVIFHSDKFGVCHAWSHLKSRAQEVFHLMRCMNSSAAKGNFTLAIKHVNNGSKLPAVNNGIADALSRFQMSWYRIMVPNAELTPEALPEVLQALKKAIW